MRVIIKLSFAILFAFAFLFTSCTGDSALVNVDAETRAAGNMSATVKKLDGTTFTQNVSKISFAHLSGTGFTVTLNPGTIGAQSYTATQVSINEPDNSLKLTVGTTVYSNKSTALLQDVAAGVKATINPGAIIVTSTAIIGDEADGV